MTSITKVRAFLEQIASLLLTVEFLMDDRGNFVDPLARSFLFNQADGPMRKTKINQVVSEEMAQSREVREGTNGNNNAVSAGEIDMLL